MVLIYVPVVKGYDIFAYCFCHLKIYFNVIDLSKSPRDTEFNFN